MHPTARKPLPRDGRTYAKKRHATEMAGQAFGYRRSVDDSFGERRPARKHYTAVEATGSRWLSAPLAQ